MTEDLRKRNGEKRVSSIKKETELPSHTYAKINLKWVKDLDSPASWIFKIPVLYLKWLWA